jgi:hypothetical protein
LLGRVGGRRLSIGGYIDVPLTEIARNWGNGLERLLS